MAPKTVLIKKYENRRLYDATNSRYVNLEDVARILQQGDDVRVVDVASGEDITRLILTQIIVEGAKAGDSRFPLDVLRDMVIASGRASQESALRYTRAMLDLYKSAYQAMSPAFNPFDFVPGADQEAPAAPVKATAAEAAPERASEPRSSEVDTLKARVAELERLVTSLAEKKQSRRAAAGKGRPRGKADV